MAVSASCVGVRRYPGCGALHELPYGGSACGTERIVIENKSVVFDLGEYTLTMDEDFSTDYSVALRAGTNGILTIEAGTNGTIDAQNAHDYLVPVAAMASGSQVIINGGTIIVNTAYESCVYAGGGGTVMIEDGVFKNLCQKPFAYVQDGSSPALAVNISDSYTDGGAYLTINGGTFVGRNPMLGDTNPGVTSSYMGSDVNIAQLSDGSFAAVGADDPLPEDTEYFYTEKDGEIVVTVYTPEALAAAVAGDETFADNTFTVVRLGAAIEQSITIADGRVLTLDLNGFTLSNTAGSHTITNSGTLTIIDGGENGEVTNRQIYAHGRPLRHRQQQGQYDDRGRRDRGIAEHFIQHDTQRRRQ